MHEAVVLLFPSSFLGHTPLISFGEGYVNPEIGTLPSNELVGLCPITTASSHHDQRIISINTREELELGFMAPFFEGTGGYFLNASWKYIQERRKKKKQMDDSCVAGKEPYDVTQLRGPSSRAK